jgi:hypothetical protein
MVTSVLTLGIALFFLAPVAAAILAPHWLEGRSLVRSRIAPAWSSSTAGTTPTSM